MAKSNDNVLTRGATGTFGKQIVFRQSHGQTIMSKPPKASNVPPTDKQLAVQDRFLAASSYAKAAISDEALKAAYNAVAKPGQSAYNRALADAFKPPVIKDIDRSQYTGQPNSTIRIFAIDDFKVHSVYVTIRDQADVVLEEGQAVTDTNSQYWIYTASVENINLPGTKVTVVATDLPGNAATQDLVL